MRQQPDIAALRTLIAAIPADTLPAVMLALMLDGATPAKALPTPAPAKRRGGWPAGRKRGRPRKAALAAAAAAAGERLAQQRRRDAAVKREKRAAAQQTTPKGTNGNGADNGAAITPAEVWKHAAKINPKSPWRALRDFEVNDQVALDAFRAKVLPPGFSGEAAAKFLEIPAS